MIINRIYEHQKSSVAVACFISGRAKGLISTPVGLCAVCGVGTNDWLDQNLEKNLHRVFSAYRPSSSIATAFT